MATLIVKVEASTGSFKREMEASARHIEAIGKRIQRAGIEISQSISLPLIAAGLAAFKVALDESSRSFGPLSVAFEQLKAQVHDVVLHVGQQLTPLFLQLIGIGRDVLNGVMAMVDAFRALPPWVQSAAIKMLLFLAALGPTLIIIGKFVKVIGSIPALIGVILSPMGLIVIAIGAVIAVGVALATHWNEVKKIASGIWLGIELFVVNAVDGILAALERLAIAAYLPGMVDTFTAARDKMGQFRLEILRAQHAVVNLKGSLEKTGGAGRDVQLIMGQLSDALKLNAVRSAILGTSYNMAAADAAALQTAIDALTAKSVPATLALDAQGRTLTNLAQSLGIARQAGQVYGEVVGEVGRRVKDVMADIALFQNLMQHMSLDQALKRFKDLKDVFASIGDAIKQGLTDAFTALGTQLGDILGGIAHGFHDFGHTLEGLLGNMLKTVGQVLIAFGLAGITIQRFAVNPYAAIAAGVAMIALGTALSGAAQRALDVSAAGGGGGGTAAPSAPTVASSAEPQGIATINIYGDPYLDMSNPVVRDRFSQALRDARNFRDIQINWLPA